MTCDQPVQFGVNWSGLSAMTNSLCTVLAAGLAFICSLGTGRHQAPPLVLVSFRECTLTDAAGVPRGTCHIDAEGVGRLRLMYPDGKGGPWVQNGASVASLGIRSHDRRQALVVGTSTESREVGLHWQGLAGDSGMSLRTGEESSGLAIMTPTGQAMRWSLRVLDGRGTSIRLFDDHMFESWSVNRR